jgi:hypothetical protein
VERRYWALGLEQPGTQKSICVEHQMSLAKLLLQGSS